VCVVVCVYTRMRKSTICICVYLSKLHVVAAGAMSALHKVARMLMLTDKCEVTRKVGALSAVYRVAECKVIYQGSRHPIRPLQSCGDVVF